MAESGGETRNVQIHPIEWTPDRVQRFWEWFASSPQSVHYFARMVGDVVIETARRQGALHSPVLDFGSGPGFLLDHLVRQPGITFAAADSSPGSLEVVRQRFDLTGRLVGTYLVSGMPTTLPGAHFGTVFLLETVEHLLGQEIGPILDELRRVLRPGGFLVVTTPNEEDLDAGKVACPECGAVFHTIQHVTTFSAATLSALLASHGFVVRRVVTTTLRPRSLRSLVRGAAARLAGRKPANLVAVVRAPGSG